MLTYEDIQKMTPEEVAAANKTLALQAVGKFVLLMTAKWAVIIGLGLLAKRLLKSLPEN